MIALKEAGALLALRLNELVNYEVRRLWDELGEAELLKNSILELNLGDQIEQNMPPIQDRDRH